VHNAARPCEDYTPVEETMRPRENSGAGWATAGGARASPRQGQVAGKEAHTVGGV